MFVFHVADTVSKLKKRSICFVYIEHGDLSFQIVIFGEFMVTSAITKAPLPIVVQNAVDPGTSVFVMPFTFDKL